MRYYYLLRIYRHSLEQGEKNLLASEDQSMLPDLSLMFIIQLMPPEVNLLLEPHSETTLNQMVHNQKQTILNLPLVIFFIANQSFPLNPRRMSIPLLTSGKSTLLNLELIENVTFLLRLTFISHRKH